MKMINVWSFNFENKKKLYFWKKVFLFSGILDFFESLPQIFSKFCESTDFSGLIQAPPNHFAFQEKPKIDSSQFRHKLTRFFVSKFLKFGNKFFHCLFLIQIKEVHHFHIVFVQPFPEFLFLPNFNLWKRQF